jgi:1-acyl-sn-glycerol-3-phosphate acyltransferase
MGLELRREADREARRAATTQRTWSDPLRWLALPWTILVFYPLVVVTTVFWGAVAIAIAAFSQRIAFWCGTAWAWCLTWASFVRVRVEGREHARSDRSYVLLTNHQGDYDILALYGFLRLQFRFVIKQELRKVPFLGWACAAIGHIFVDRSNSRRAVSSLDAAKPKLVGGVSVLFFPEGTRSEDGSLLPFKQGGFVMARQLGLPILPMTISGSLRILPKGCLAPRPGTIRIRIHPPIEPEDAAASERLTEEVREIIGSGLSPEERGD